MMIKIVRRNSYAISFIIYNHIEVGANVGLKKESLRYIYKEGERERAGQTESKIVR